MLGDVLKPLDFADSTFDAWIDKGLVDAMFGTDGEQERMQLITLLRSAARVLKSSGLWICITLAQEHIIRLIVEAVLATSEEWATLELHPLNPKSNTSALRPFALVLRPRPSGCESSEVQLVMVSDGQSTKAVVQLSFHNLFKMVEKAREEFGPVMQLFMAVAAQKAKRQNEERRSLTFVAVKTWEPDEDKKHLADRLRVSCAKLDFVEWKSSTTIPIGFGIEKLELQLVVPSAQIECLCETLEEDEAVQSVDIDWEKTQPTA